MSEQPPADPREQPVREVLHPPLPLRLLYGYQATPESIARAKVEAATERAEVDATLKAYELERHAAIEILSDIVEAHGITSVQIWLRNIAVLTGKSL